MRSFSRFIRFPLIACAVLGAHLAWADPPKTSASVGDDEVTLKDGGTLRGTIVTQEPGRQVDILVLGENAPRVVPWVDVDRIERGKYAAHASQPQVTPSPASKGAPGLGDPGIVALHITSPVPVNLFGHIQGFAETEAGHVLVLDAPAFICASPCDARIDTRPSRVFTVGSDDVVRSEEFALTGLSGNQELVVSPGNPTVRNVGGLFTALGGVALGFGTVMTIGGAVAKADEPSAVKFETAGLVTLASAGAFLIGGIIMIATSNTTIDLHPSDPPARANGKAARAAARAPHYWAGEF